MDMDIRLLWTRPPGMLPFRSRNLVLWKNVVVAILPLSSGNVELHLGPPTNIKGSKTKPLESFLNFGSLNVRSAVDKASQIHDIMNDFNLDILALEETWTRSDDSPAIKVDIASPVFSCLHVHRETASCIYIYIYIYIYILYI